MLARIHVQLRRWVRDVLRESTDLEDPIAVDVQNAAAVQIDGRSVLLDTGLQPTDAHGHLGLRDPRGAKEQAECYRRHDSRPTAGLDQDPRYPAGPGRKAGSYLLTEVVEEREAA